MKALDFNVHDCPASPGDPRDGESWDAYKARCDVFRDQWLARQRSAALLGCSQICEECGAAYATIIVNATPFCDACHKGNEYDL